MQKARLILKWIRESREIRQAVSCVPLCGWNAVSHWPRTRRVDDATEEVRGIFESRNNHHHRHHHRLEDHTYCTHNERNIHYKSEKYKKNTTQLKYRITKTAPNGSLDVWRVVNNSVFWSNSDELILIQIRQSSQRSVIRLVQWSPKEEWTLINNIRRRQNITKAYTHNA